jgi:hypothetical protein
MVHQRPLNFHTICNGSNLTVFNGLPNDNKIIWNLNEHQSIGRRVHIYKKKLFFNFIFSYLLTNHCQNYQINPFSTDPHLYMNWKLTYRSLQSILAIYAAPQRLRPRGYKFCDRIKQWDIVMTNFARHGHLQPCACASPDSSKTNAYCTEDASLLDKRKCHGCWFNITSLIISKSITSRRENQKCSCLMTHESCLLAN